jgi:hypothetical protein
MWIWIIMLIASSIFCFIVAAMASQESALRDEGMELLAKHVTSNLKYNEEEE